MTETRGPSGPEHGTLRGDEDGGAADVEAQPAAGPVTRDDAAHDGAEHGARDVGHGTHGEASHGALGGHGETKPLGPVDWSAWAGGILGVAAGLLAAGCLWLSTSGL